MLLGRFHTHRFINHLEGIDRTDIDAEPATGTLFPVNSDLAWREKVLVAEIWDAVPFRGRDRTPCTISEKGLGLAVFNPIHRMHGTWDHPVRFSYGPADADAVGKRIGMINTEKLFPLLCDF